MNLINSLLTVLKKGNSNESVPEGFCPNCWGRQEYGGNFYQAVRNHGLDANAKEPEVGWIQDYVNKNLSPIVLHKEGDEYNCSRCKTSYKKLNN